MTHASLIYRDNIEKDMQLWRGKKWEKSGMEQATWSPAQEMKQRHYKKKKGVIRPLY